MAIKYIVLFVETPRKFITAKLSIRKPGSSSVLIIYNNNNRTIPFLDVLFTIHDDAIART